MTVLAIAAAAIVAGLVWFFPLYFFSSLFLVFALVIAFFAKFGVFTEVLTGTQKFVKHGSKWVKTLFGDSPAFFLWAFFGKHFAGFSFQNFEIHTFELEIKRENQNRGQTDPATGKKDERCVINLGKVLQTFLRNNINSVVELPEVEVKSKQKVRMLISMIYKVIDGKKFVFDYFASFIPGDGLVISKINTKINGMEDYQAVVDAGGRILDSLILDNELRIGLQEFGLELFEINVVEIATDRALEDAAAEVAEQKILNEVIILKSEAMATATKNTGFAEADVIKAKAAAPILGKIDVLKEKGFTNEEIKVILNITSLPDAIRETALQHLTILGGDKKIGTNINV